MNIPYLHESYYGLRYPPTLDANAKPCSNPLGGKILSKMENRWSWRYGYAKTNHFFQLENPPCLKMYFRISILKNGGIFLPASFVQVQLRPCSSHCHGRCKHSSLFQCKHSSNHSWPQECKGAKQKWGWKSLTTWSKFSGWFGRIFVEHLSFLVFFWLIHTMINVDLFCSEVMVFLRSIMKHTYISGLTR